MSAVVLIRGLKSRFASQQLEENGHFAKVRFTLHVDSHFYVLWQLIVTIEALGSKTKRFSNCGRSLLLYKIWCQGIKIGYCDCNGGKSKAFLGYKVYSKTWFSQGDSARVNSDLASREGLRKENTLHSVRRI